MNNTQKKGIVARKRYQYDPADMDKAVESVQKNILGLRQASKKYGVPYETVRDRASGRYKSKGKTTVLTSEEEKQFCEWISYAHDRRFPLSKHQLLDSVQIYLNEEKRTTQFTDNRPGRDWYDRFLKRNQTVAVKIAESLNKSQTKLTENSTRDWFAEVKTVLIAIHVFLFLLASFCFIVA